MLYQSRSNSLHSIVEMILSLLLLMIYGIIIIYSKPLDIESDTPLTISFNPSSNQVQLNQPLIIRCEVHSFNNKQLEVNNNNNNILNGYSMFFQCPIAPWGKFCFHNCQSACVGEIPNQCPYDNELSLIKCRTAMTEQGYLFYEYTIPNLTETWLGLNHNNNNNNNNNNTSMDKDNHRNKIEGFSCKTAGLETPRIPLTIVKPNDIQSNIMGLSKTKTSSSSSSNSHSMISHLNETISNEYNTQKDDSNRLNNGMNQSIKRINSELKAALTREVLIIGAIIIVFISVILNVFCCIRCALIRQYSRSKDQPHMQHLFCMAEEIRNARIVKQINGKGFNYRDKVGYEQQQHLGTLLHDGHKMNKKGSSLLLMNKIQSQSNGYESYQPSIDYGSEYLTGLNCPGFLLNDNQSSNGLSSDIHLRYLPDGKSGNRQSISAFSIVPGQFPISWTHHNNSNSNIEAHRRSITSIQRNGGNSLASHHSSQQQITEAVTNFYLQHQQHFKELQNHLNNTNTTNTTTNNNSNIDTVTMNQLGSDGMNSCFGSIGQPDSSILSDININPSNAMNCESPIMNRHNNDNHIILNNIMPLTNSSMNPSNYIIPIDSINPLINNYTNQLTPNINRIQPIGSSQSQLITLMNKLNYTTNTTNNTTNNQSIHNEQILTHLSTLSDTLNSQSDSGAGSGSGKISMDSSENKINSF